MDCLCWCIFYISARCWCNMAARRSTKHTKKQMYKYQLLVHILSARRWCNMVDADPRRSTLPSCIRPNFHGKSLCFAISRVKASPPPIQLGVKIFSTLQLLLMLLLLKFAVSVLLLHDHPFNPQHCVLFPYTIFHLPRPVVLSHHSSPLPPSIIGLLLEQLHFRISDIAK